MCEDCDEDLLDVGCNADLYVANHESVDLIYEDQVRDISSICVHFIDQIYFIRHQSGEYRAQIRSMKCVWVTLCFCLPSTSMGQIQIKIYLFILHFRSLRLDQAYSAHHEVD